MNESPFSTDVLLFGAFPYVALVLFAAGTIERFLRHRSTLTSRSSQFLENRQHFWAMVPFHYGLLAVLTFHVVAFAAPASVLRWNASTLRLDALETVALACGLLAATGLTLALIRRVSVAAVRATTSGFDWIVLALLLAQIAVGVFVAIDYAWGSSWFAGVTAPYLRSIARLRPDVAAVAALPLPIKAHVLGAWVLVAVFPFSRLVHVLSVPAPYVWRRPQIVRWYRPRPLPLEK